MAKRPRSIHRRTNSMRGMSDVFIQGASKRAQGELRDLFFAHVKTLISLYKAAEDLAGNADLDTGEIERGDLLKLCHELDACDFAAIMLVDAVEVYGGPEH